MKSSVVFYTDENNYYCYSFYDDCVYIGENAKQPQNKILYLLAVSILPSICRSIDNVYLETGNNISIAIISVLVSMIVSMIIFLLIGKKSKKKEKKIFLKNEEFNSMLEKGYKQYCANLYLLVVLLLINTFLFIYLSFSFSAIIFFALTILSTVTIILLFWIDPLLKLKLYKNFRK